MPFELAKQLKDAGFPQGRLPDNPFSMIYPKDQQWIEGGFPKSFPHEFPTALHVDDTEGKLKIGAYAPTLEELMEACGTPFYLQTTPEWTAGKTRGMDAICRVGATPAEAVARLWLALNQKDSPHS